MRTKCEFVRSNIKLNLLQNIYSGAIYLDEDVSLYEALHIVYQTSVN